MNGIIRSYLYKGIAKNIMCLILPIDDAIKFYNNTSILFDFDTRDYFEDFLNNL